MEQLWTIDDVAAYLRVTKHTLYHWRTKGYGPPASLMGKHLRYDPDDVRAWWQRQREAA